MKILLCTLFVVVFSGINIAQTTTSFRKNYNISLFDIPITSFEGLTPNNYIFAAHHAFSSSITSIDDVGVTTWSKRFTDGISLYIGDVKKDVALNRYYVCGGDNSGPAFLMFLDPLGNLISARNFSIAEADGASFNRVIKTSDGGYVCVGTVTGYGPGGGEVKFSAITHNPPECSGSKTESIQSPLIVKFDASGNHVWHQVFRYYTGSVAPANRIYNDASFVDVVEVSDGYIAIGDYDVNNVFSRYDTGSGSSCGEDRTPTDAMIAKFTTAGTITYHRQIDTPSNSTTQRSKSFNSASLTSTGLPLISGADGDGRPMVLMRFAGSGGWANPTWIRKYGAANIFGDYLPFNAGRVFENNDGTYGVWGYYIPGFSWENVLLKINPSNSSVTWAKRYTFNFASILPQGEQTSDDGYIGVSYTLAGSGHNLHVIKTDPNGDSSSDCPVSNLTVSDNGPSYTWGTPFYNNWNANTVTNGTYTPTIANITPTESTQCLTIVTECIPPSAPSTVNANPSPICPGETATITASGPSDPDVTYNVYAASTGGTSLGATPHDVNPGVTTSYWVEAANISDPNCVSTTRTEVVVNVTPGAPAANAGPNQDICGNSATLAGNTPAPGTGEWTLISGSGTITTPSSPTSTVTNLGEGNNVFEWTITSGSCPNTSAQVTITSSPTPTVSNAGSTQIICASSTTLEGNVATSGTGEWTLVSGTGTITDPSNPTTTVTGLGIGDNIFEWTISSGSCTASSTQVTITNTGGPTLSITSIDDASCFGATDGIATVEATGGAGGFIYSWSPTGGSSATSNPLPAGSYTVTVQDAASCSDDIVVVIGEPDEIELDMSSTPSSCSTPDGTASVIASGGDGNYSYDWSSGGNLDTETDLSAGNYTVTVTDGNNCEATGNVSVLLSDGPVITVEATNDASCFGASNGSAEISVTGGDGNYTYAWSPTGGSSATATNLPAGTYTVTVTDGNDCVVDETITIGQADQIVVAGAVTNALCTGEDGDITLSVSGGDAPYTYLWSPNGETTASISAGGGTYAVTVTDSEGCEITENYTIGVTNNLNATIDPNGATIEGGQSVDLEVVLNPAAPNATYTWTPTEGLSCTNCPNPTASPSETTTYVVAVTTGDGCSDTAMVTVVVNDPCGDIFMPTIFSPNGDGQNDELCLLGSCIVELDLKIYNRWGELVFETTDQSDCWDGTFRGRPMNSAVFVYKLVVRTTDGTELEESGNVNLVR